MTLDIVSLSLLGWIPVCASLFLFFKPVRALTLAYLIGWLLLPVDSLDLKGFWDVDKVLATNFGVILGAVCFCPSRLKRLRMGVPEWILLFHALGSGATSLVNQLGIYDGASSFVYRVLYTAVPFCFGRAFVRSRADLMEVARLIVYASSVYALLAIWEWRMSPQIHRTLYGYFQHSFHQHIRWGFYRPIVCFRHALGLGTFFAWTSLLAITMHRTGQLRQILVFPPGVHIVLPLFALLCCMSLGPWGLFAMGLSLYLFRARQRWRWTLWLPLCLAFGWMGGRYTGALDGQWMEAAVGHFAPDRAKSLHARIYSETVTLEHAAEKQTFGWGGFGRSRVKDKSGNEVVTDGLWIILLGMYGVVGLATFYLWWCWPVIMTRKAASGLAEDPVIFAILIAVGMQAVNLLFNGFLSPILTLTTGGVVSAMYAQRSRQRASRAAAAMLTPDTPQTQARGYAP